MGIYGKIVCVWTSIGRGITRRVGGEFGNMGISKYRLCLDQYIWKKNDHFLTEISDTRRSDGCMSCWS